MNKQYTTEEITRRLKAGESVTYRNDDNPISLSTSYNDGSIFFNAGVICYELCHFNKIFMFTSDYEAMKSEEAKDTLKQGDLHDAPTDIPEWLQRERVMFWVNAFIASKGQTTFDCSNYADKCLEQFDKRFLTQKETK